MDTKGKKKAVSGASPSEKESGPDTKGPGQTENPGKKLQQTEEAGGTLPRQADQKIRKLGQYPSEEEGEENI